MIFILVVSGIALLVAGFMVGYGFSNEENKNKIESLEKDVELFRVALRSKKIRK